MSYGPALPLATEAATHAGEILRGAKPADLPVEEPTRIALALNTETASSPVSMFGPSACSHPTKYSN
jgi:hypothetical protein